MSDVESIFKVNLDDEIRDVFYYQLISDEKEKIIFVAPWGAALVRNCSANGQYSEGVRKRSEGWWSTVVASPENIEIS